ncbi:exported hypothetical protein [uncultured delta proteobacterium]|uniref:Uncharacterized protein n=1 Tax=uncultured delta proteobacterium TaxID=34034 RepID=A0A212KDJ8_9DELT|nr:exported hypothetical protein [uncultured delta proteobacterium]
MSTKKKTVSLANTPVQRALAKAKRSTLIILFAVGIAAGFVYKAYFQDKPGDATPPAAATAQP